MIDDGSSARPAVGDILDDFVVDGGCLGGYGDALVAARGSNVVLGVLDDSGEVLEVAGGDGARAVAAESRKGGLHEESMTMTGVKTTLNYILHALLGDGGIGKNGDGPQLVDDDGGKVREVMAAGKSVGTGIAEGEGRESTARGVENLDSGEVRLELSGVDVFVDPSVIGRVVTEQPQAEGENANMLPSGSGTSGLDRENASQAINETASEVLRDIEQEERERAEGPRVTAVQEATTALSRRPAFDAATYAPPVHLFVPSTLESYTPTQEIYEGETVLLDLQQHISRDCLEVNKNIDTYGSTSRCLELYDHLHEDVRALVRSAGFGDFIPTLSKTMHDKTVVTALVERWRDSTNTLHLPCGEATMTPLDFAALTGLRVGGDPIPFDSGLGEDKAALQHFLGWQPNCGDSAPISQFADHCLGAPETPEEASQKARSYLLFLFGATLFPNRRNRVHLGYLPALQDLRQASRFDWGGCALSTCYAFFSSASRGVAHSIAGLWFVWEFWAYEVLGLSAPKSSHPERQILPRALVWGKGFRGSSKARGRLDLFRTELDQLTDSKVRWGVWDGLEADYLPRSREMTRGRVLLESPYGWQWYLGDRVVRQSLRRSAPVVPGPLPPRVLRTDSYTLEELVQFTTLDVGLDRYLRPTEDYVAYQRQYLAGPLGVVEFRQREIAAREASRAREEAQVPQRGKKNKGGRGSGGQRESSSAEGGEDPSRSSGHAAARLWAMSVQTPDGEKGWVDIPRPAADLVLPPAPISQESAYFYYEQTRGLRVLVRQLVAGAHVPIRRPGDPLPPVVPGPLLSREVQPPVCRKRLRSAVTGPGSTTVRLSQSKSARAVPEEEEEVPERRVTRRRRREAATTIVESGSDDDVVGGDEDDDTVDLGDPSY